MRAVPWALTWESVASPKHQHGCDVRNVGQPSVHRCVHVYGCQCFPRFRHVNKMQTRLGRVIRSHPCNKSMYIMNVALGMSSNLPYTNPCGCMCMVVSASPCIATSTKTKTCKHKPEQMRSGWIPTNEDLPIYLIHPFQL